MRKSNLLRLQPSLSQEARKLAESEGVALNSADQSGGSGESLGIADRKLHRGSTAAARRDQDFIDAISPQPTDRMKRGGFKPTRYRSM
jgi:hypothetical protein